MLKLFYIAGLILLDAAIFSGTEIETMPCDFFDTVNVTGSQRLVNGSCLYQDLLIPSELMAEYTYTVLPDGTREPAETHLRGCVCKLRTCLRFCCHHSQLMGNGQCSGSVDLTRLNPYVNVTLQNGTVFRGHFQKEFILQSDLPKPCNEMYSLNDREETDQYTVFENGSLLRSYDNVTMSKRDYCLQPEHFKEGETASLRIVAHNCAIKSGDKTGQTFVLICSLVCLSSTIIVYRCLKKLRNLHGNCFVCCLICLFMGYLFLLLDLWELTNNFCATAGYTGYYFVMSTFLWLSVISWDLRSSLGSSQGASYQSKYLFLLYSIYAWGMAFIFTAVIYLVDHLVEDNPENEPWMPGVTYYSCWIKTHDWSAMLYLYGPMLIVIIFNSTMFILTAIEIIAVKRQLQVVVDRQERKQKHNSDKQTYGLFLRLFIIMGVNWSLEIVSYLVQNHEFWKRVLRVADYFNWSLGIIIFCLFVTKLSVLKLFKKGYQSRNIRSVVSMKSHGSRNTTAAKKLPRDTLSSQASTQI
ncbi:G-protein coupled receptor Mth isoform X1 [Drosophila guanche]|uniref:G-protein coupled receptor Mth isoform X1 n=1 Tax=Drosophila guanche TaxID=7266 RepID=UPI00147228E5|nr:G-protein coupled receptor Mth isoform X1 [Drosophila guanche]